MAKADSLFYKSFVRLFELRFLIMLSCFHENIGEISWGLPLWDLEERMAEWTSDKSHQCPALWKLSWINIKRKARIQDWIERNSSNVIKMSHSSSPTQIPLQVKQNPQSSEITTAATEVYRYAHHLQQARVINQWGALNPVHCVLWDHLRTIGFTQQSNFMSQ